MFFPTRLLQESADVGPLFGWGQNSGDQLGVPGANTLLVPTQVGTYRRWRKVSITGNYGLALAIRDDGTLWGAGLNSLIGNGSGSGRSNEFVQVGTGTGWTDVSAGSEQAIGILNGSLYAWGDEVSSTPKKIGSNSDWDMVAAGADDGALALRNGRLYFIPGFDGTPAQVGSFTDWIHISASNALNAGDVVAIREGGSLYHGEIDDGAPTMSRVGTDTGWTDASCNSNGAFAAIRGGMLYTWGKNDDYQTGQNTNSGSTDDPTLASELSGWIKVSMGENYFGSAIRRSRLYSWGRNQSCQTGIGTSSGYAKVPTQVGPYGGWLDVSCGTFAAMGIRA
jgi:hypothetical protein